jgi:hypothetical protein
METTRRPADDLLEVARALLLLQGAILVATTIESLFWSVVFPGAGGALLTSGLSAVVVLVARTRLRADRPWARRLVYAVEGLTLIAVAVDIALALALTHALPPLVALLTQLVLPVCVVMLLRRSARKATAPIPGAVVAMGGAS